MSPEQADRIFRVIALFLPLADERDRYKKALRKIYADCRGTPAFEIARDALDAAEGEGT